MTKIGYASGTCKRCGKILRRLRPADLAVCDCWEYCPICGRRMEPFTPDLTPSTYERGDVDLDLADPLGRGSRWRDFGLSRYFFSGAVDSLPPASATYRGVMVRVESGSGVADKLYVCMKSAAGAYSWDQAAWG